MELNVTCRPTRPGKTPPKYSSFLHDGVDEKNISYITKSVENQKVQLLKFAHNSNKITKIKKLPDISRSFLLKHQLISRENEILLFDQNNVHLWQKGRQWIETTNIRQLSKFKGDYQCIEIAKNKILIFGSALPPYVAELTITQDNIICDVKKAVGNKKLVRKLSFTPDYIYKIATAGNKAFIVLWDSRGSCVCEFDILQNEILSVDTKNNSQIFSSGDSESDDEELFHIVDNLSQVKPIKRVINEDSYELSNPIVIIQGITNYMKDVKEDSGFETHIYRLMREFEIMFRTQLNYQNIIIDHITDWETHYCEDQSDIEVIFEHLNDKIKQSLEEHKICDGLIYVYVGNGTSEWVRIIGNLVWESTLINMLCYGISDDIPKLFMFCKNAYQKDWVKKGDYLYRQDLNIKNCITLKTYDKHAGKDRDVDFVEGFCHLVTFKLDESGEWDIGETCIDDIFGYQQLHTVEVKQLKKLEIEWGLDKKYLIIKPCKIQNKIPPPLMVCNDVLFNFGVIFKMALRVRMIFEEGTKNTKILTTMKSFMEGLAKIKNQEKYLKNQFRMKDEEIRALLLYLELYSVIHEFTNDKLRLKVGFLRINSIIARSKQKLRSIDEVIKKGNDKLTKICIGEDKNFKKDTLEKSGYLEKLKLLTQYQGPFHMIRKKKKQVKEIDEMKLYEIDDESDEEDSDDEESEEKKQDDNGNNKSTTNNSGLNSNLDSVFQSQTRSSKKDYLHQIAADLQSLGIDKKESYPLADFLIDDYSFVRLFHYEQIYAFRIYKMYRINMHYLQECVSESISTLSSALVLQIVKLFYENVRYFLEDKDYEQSLGQRNLEIFVANCIRAKMDTIKKLVELDLDEKKRMLKMTKFQKISLNLFRVVHITKQRYDKITSPTELNHSRQMSDFIPQLHTLTKTNAFSKVTSPKNKNSKHSYRYNEILLPPDDTYKMLLVQWGLEQYVESFRTNRHTNVNDWASLQLNTLKTDLRMKAGHAKKFIRLAKAYFIKDDYN